MATLGEVLTDEQITQLDDLISRRKITPDWVQGVFIPRLSADLRNIDFWEQRYNAIEKGGARGPLEMSSESLAEKRKELQWRRQNLFQRALDSDNTVKIEREVEALQRGFIDWKEPLVDYLKERGPVGVAYDVGKSLVETIPRGVAATGQTLGEGGLGETPIQRIGEMTGAATLFGGVTGGLAHQLGRSALKSAGTSVIRGAGGQITRKALKEVPDEALKAALASGVGAGRGGLAKQLSRVAEGTRVPAYIGEAADIAGAGENLSVEALLEVLGEGAMEGGRFAGRRAVRQLSGETQDSETAEADPLAVKQQQRADENDAAAAARTAKNNAAKINAALDLDASRLTQIAQQIVAGKTELAPDDYAGIEDTALVEAVENHIVPRPEFQSIIDTLETLGLQNAGDALRARILELHQQDRDAVAQQAAQTAAPEAETPTQTPEQSAAADLAGQPTAEIPPELQPAPPPPRTTPQPQAEQTPGDTGTQTPVNLPEGYAGELTEESLLEMSEDVSNNLVAWMLENGEEDASVEDIVDQQFTEGVAQGAVTEEDAQILYPHVLARVTEMLPIARVENEAAEVRSAEIDQLIEAALPNINYQKNTVGVRVQDGSLLDVEGYSVEGTGIDYANIFITHHPQTNAWIAIEAQTGQPLLGNESYPTREAAVRAAMEKALALDEADYRTEILGEQPDVESTPAETPEETTTPAEQGETSESAEGAAETPTAETPQQTPEEKAAQIVAGSMHPNTNWIQQNLENLNSPIDARTFMTMFGDQLPVPYTQDVEAGTLAVDILLNQLANDENSPIYLAETTAEGVRKYTVEPAVPEASVGTETEGFESDGVTGHRVQPVLRELDAIVPSHELSGSERRDYPDGLQPRDARGGVISMEQVRTTARQPNFAFLLEFFRQFRDGAPLTSKKYPRRVVSGNGRTLALQLMQQNHPENWQGYQDALRTELEKVGIDPAEADAMENPVLTYELMDLTNEPELAKDANRGSTLDNTAAEQAGDDAAYFDDELMGLWKDTSGDFITALKSEENQAFREAFINRVPTHLQPGFMTTDGTDFSSTGVNRIQNAIIKYVFGDDIGGQLARIFIETDPEDFNKSLGALIRNSVATLAHAKANGHDIGQELAAAILRFIEINTLSNRDKRDVAKKEKLYNQIELFYKDIPLLPVALIEKQLLYLLYARRAAPRRLTNDLQQWSRNAIEIAQAETDGLFGGTGRSNTDIYEEIFTGIIRNTIRDIAFQSSEDAVGRVTLLPPERMPHELVELREGIDKIPSVEGKEQFLSDWTDAFLKFMNDGEPQAEIQPLAGEQDATPTDPTETAVDNEGTRSRTPDRRPPGSDPPTPDGPDDTSERGGGVAAGAGRNVEGDEQRRVEGETDRTPAGETTQRGRDGGQQQTAPPDRLTLANQLKQAEVEHIPRPFNPTEDYPPTWQHYKIGETGIVARIDVAYGKGTNRRRAFEIDLSGDDIDSIRVEVKFNSVGVPKGDSGWNYFQAAVEQAVKQLSPKQITIKDPHRVLAAWIQRNMPDDDSASPRQKLIVAIVQHLQSTDTPLTHAELLAGYSAAVGFDVASRANAEGLIQDVYDYLEQAITETLAKPDIQAKGITREMLLARLPSRPESQETPQETPTSESGEVSDVEEALKIASVGTVSLDEWNAADTAGQRSFLSKQEQSIPVHLQTGAINAEEAARRRAAIEVLRQNIQATPSAKQTPAEQTPTEPEAPVDTNMVVGVSRRQQTQAPSSVSPLIKRGLDIFGISVETWEQEKAEGTAEALVNTLPQETMEQLDAAADLAADIAGEMSPEDSDVDTADDMSSEGSDVDDDLFKDVEGRMRDVTDQQRSDFDTIRRKLFLAKAIARLEAKGADRTNIENVRLRALTATQRTDAQQEIYAQLLQSFVDNQVQRLTAKPQRSATEDRVLETLTAVQAEGIPEDASDLSLYSDLDTPDQAHSRPLSETRTLAGVQAPDTSETELDLPEDVTSDTKKLSPAQASSVRAILAAFARKIHVDTDTTVQGGFLLGDKPGVGKTRQALAAMWHYMRQGISRHFVIAPNQQLLNNYTTDMEAMGGPSGDISNYSSRNQKLTTPIGTATYSMLIKKPNLNKFHATTGNQNAIADIVEHLTGVRPTLQQTHPGVHRATLEAYQRIMPNLKSPITLEGAVKELRRQASTVNLDNPEHVENFRRRVTPEIADLLLADRTESVQQQIFTKGEGADQEITTGTELHERVGQLLTFAETHIAGQPDPDFAAQAAAFEGVIVLDEMHKAAGLNSQTGQLISQLHRLLPNAKFLYMSATPFKEIDNFRVAERLGLWGANQPFPSFPHFRRAFRSAARAVKEIIPLHLKQIGRYISRALSSAETRYTPVEVPLTDVEKQQYDTAVQFVQGIRLKFEAAIDAAVRTNWGHVIENEGEFHQYRAKYMRNFYGATQGFFLALLDSMKAQGLQENIREKLLAGDKVIVQLENTWDKSIERAQQRGKTGTIGPFDLLIDFVESEGMFPIHQHTMEVRKRNDGSEYTVVVPLKVYDDNGELVRAVDPQLKQLQTELLNMLQSEMQASDAAGGIGFAADIIHSVALEANATSGEISGRSHVYPQDTPTQMPQDTESRIARAKAFSETTDLNLIILGPAGLTGLNLPISEIIKEKVGGLFHYLVQSSWNVNTFEQGLGRGKRSNSAIDPHYMVVHQDLPGADRVLGATLAKFAEMGALAGQADNALMHNIDKVEGETSIEDDPEADVVEETEADVFEEDEAEGGRSHVFGTHGQEALAQLWYEIHQSQEYELVDTLGLTRPEIAGSTGQIDPDTIPSVKQFFQRLLHQDTTNQPRLYQEFEARLKRILALRRELGELDVGASNLNSSDGQITDRLTVYTDPDTGQTAEVVRLDVKRQLPRRSWDFLQKVVRGEPGYEHHGGSRFKGIYTDADGHVWAIFDNPFSKGDEVSYTRWGPRGTPVQGIHQGEHRISEVQLASDFTHVSIENQPQITDVAEAKRLWEAEDETADAFVDSEMFMATGLILPKWQDFTTGNYRQSVMAVIPMLDGSNLHGRVLPSGVLPQVLRQLGAVNPNHFDAQRRATPDATQTPADPNIDIPAIVRDIIGKETDTQVSSRLEGIVEHIHKKLPLRLRGHLVRSPAEAAVLGQLIRDPQVEHTWIVYRREGRILKIEPISLNKKGETEAGDFEHIKSEIAELGADSILRIHNHPSGVAKWSPADKQVAMKWHQALGTVMAEDIIVDSGTYAYRTFVNGEYTWHADIALEPGAAGWATGAETIDDATGQSKPTDPLRVNPLLRGARDAATYGLQLKYRTDVAELVFIDPTTGKIADTVTDAEIRTAEDPASHIADLLSQRQRQGQHVHVMTWGNADLATALEGVEGVDSVWVNSTRHTGISHIGDGTQQETITRDIGGNEQTFVKVSDKLSDANSPNSPILTKSVVIAGRQHQLEQDTRREELGGVYNRRADAEHMVSDRRAQMSYAEASPIVEEKLKAQGIEQPVFNRKRVLYEHLPIQEFKKRYAEVAKTALEFDDQQIKTRLKMIDRVHQRSPDDMKKVMEAFVYHRDLSPRLEAIVEKLTENPRNDFRARGYTFHDLLIHYDSELERSERESEINREPYEKHVEEHREYIRLLNTEISRYLEEHGMSQEDVHKAIGEEGRIRATHRSGDPNVNQGLLAYTSYGPYYRRGMHDNGYILDLKKMLDRIPGITGTLHKRGVWNDRTTLDAAEIRQAMAENQGGDPDLVIEIRIPQDIDVNEYLVGIIENREVYVKKDAPPEWLTPEVQADLAGQPRDTDSDDTLLRDYQPTAETPHINRAARAMPTKSNLNLQGKGKTRKWISPQSQLFEKLRLWTPKLRKEKRVIDNARRSGYGILEELKAPWDSDKPGPGNIIEDMLDQRMHISQTWTGRTRSVLLPVLKKLQDQVKRSGGENAQAVRAAVDNGIINFIEHNTPLRSELRAYQGVATELKEAWRKVNQSFVEAMIQFMRDISHREEITKHGTRGIEKWSPEPLGEMAWDWKVANGEGRFVDKQGNPYTIAEAFARTEKLWYPHQYDRSRLRDYNRKIENLVKSLNALAVAGDNASEDDLRVVGVTKVDGGYRHNRVNTVFPDIDGVIKFYTDIRDRTATLLKWFENGTIGLYPHLERVRETHDRLYRRDTNLLMSTSSLLWDRFAEIATFGQIDPYGKTPPRLATLLQTVELFNANTRETALMAVVDGLQATKESRIAAGEDAQDWGMHESIPAFEGGERAALDIMQMWEDYYIDKDGEKVKTGKWKGIDINRLKLDEKTLAELQQIGFIESDGAGGWQVHGKSDAAQQKTIARFFVELMQTKANRKKRIEALVQSLGHWQQRDPLKEDSDELWKRLNTFVSIGALGWRQALQNLTEIPIVVMLAGLKSTAGLVKEMRDPDFRAAANELTQGLKQGVEFLADDNLQERVLNSKWSLFGATERLSRMLGVGVGLTHAKNLSQELLASQEGSKNRARIEREMRKLRMNPAAILHIPPGDLDAIFSEVIQRIKSGDLALAGVELPSKTPPKNEMTDRMGEEWVRSAMFVSDSAFKPYDARTLPPEFQKDSAFSRMILKFKGWMYQQNRFMVDESKRAMQEAIRHQNYRPLRNILASTLLLTGSVGMTQMMFSLLQGRDDEDDKLLRAFLHTQTLGLSAVLWEMALRSEGSPWRLEKNIEGTLVGPVWGTFADVLSPTVTGDLDRSLQEVLQRTPGAREMLHLGANRWWEDDE